MTSTFEGDERIFAAVNVRAMRSAFLATVLALLGAMNAAAQPPVVVVIETERGIIEIAVDIARAPITSANFLRYVDNGFYDGGTFHRTVRMDNQPQNDVKIEVIQAGIDAGRRKQSFGRIALERTSVTGLKHVDGAISMARGTPDSAVSDFFICINDQPSLDFGGARNTDGQGFAAFGRVVRGMDVVKKIQAGAADAQRLTPPIRILSARRKTA